MKVSAYFVCLLIFASSNLSLAVPTAATQPATTDSPLQRVRAALTLSPKDKLLLSSLRDGTDPVEQNGFYRMMRIIENLPVLSAGELRRLDSPAWSNLLREPSRYRGKPIRWPLRVYVVRERTVGKGLRANPYWPDDKPIYEIHATREDSDDEPLLLYAVNPPANLPLPSETLADGRIRYKTGPVYQVAGVYLQYDVEMSTDSAQADGVKRKYPVLLAWQFKPRKSSAADSFFGPFTQKEQLYTWGAALAVMIAAVGLFLFVQRRLRRPSAAQRGPEFKKYHPLRDEEPAPEKSEDDEFVDPNLTAAVEEYQKNHPFVNKNAKNEDTP